MKWEYKGEKYKTVKVDWDYISTNVMQLPDYLELFYPDRARHPVVSVSNKYLWDEDVFYVPKHDACYTMENFGVFGNGNRVKFCLADIYTGKQYYCSAKNVELVIKDEG